MKKKFLALVAVLVLALACVVGIVACDGGNNQGGGGGGNEVKVGGTYYLYENGETYSELYITFKNGKWTDDEGVSGSYTLSNADITLYIEFEGEKDEYASGTVSGDDITLKIMGADAVYRKGEDIDGKPKEKMLSLALGEDKSYYIVKGIGGLTGDITVPDEYKRKPIQEIAENAFASCSELTSITISDNVTTMGKKAFYNCANLTEVVLGDGVDSIEESTFEKCAKLEKITIGSSVAKLGYNAFYSCLELKSIYYNGTVSDWAEIEFVSNPLSDNNIYIVGNNTAYAKNRSRDLYIDNELLVNATITDAEKISDSAFFGYVQLEGVTIGGSVSEIGEKAFYECASLETLDVTGGVNTISKLAFCGCNSLTTVSLADSVKTIGERAFDSCENLVTVNIGNGVTYIAKGAFMACENLSSLTLGSAVLEICENAFYSCYALESVTIPSSAIFIGKNAFFATGITSATFKNTSGWQVDKAGGYETVENLSDANNAATLLKNGLLMQVPGYADYDWEKPTLQYTLSSDKTYYTVNNNGTTCRSEIVIPEKYNDKPVRALRYEAFYGCTSLKSISLPGCMMDIPNDAFSGCTALESIEIRGYLVSDYEEVYASRDGMLYNADYTELLYIPLGKTEITIMGMTEIPDGMFSGKIGLKKIIIGSDVTSIGANAFDYCPNLTNFELPESVTSIGAYAFANCSSLTSITLGNGITSIGVNAFSDCSSLTAYCEAKEKPNGWDYEWYGNCSVVWDCKNNNKDENGYIYSVIGGIKYSLKDGVATVIRQPANISGEITIPTSVAYGGAAFNVTSIDEYAFCNCSSLTGLTIGDSVTTINRNAFSGCSGLTHVVIGKGITYINNVFAECISLKSITVDVNNPNYASQDGILYNKSKTEIVFLPRKIEGDIIIADGVTTIAVSGLSEITSITIPSSATYVSSFGNCSSLKSIVVDENNANYASQDGILYNKAKTEFVCIPAAIEGDITIPYGITSIGMSAFSHRSEIKSIIIADSVKSIGSSAFFECFSLKHIVIPDSVTSIGYQAFRSCPIETASIPAMACKYINDPSGTFNPTLKTVVITSGTKIEDYAFKYCQVLTDITIPNSVTSIGFQALYGCSELANITFQGTKEEWAGITKSYEWVNDFTGDYVVTCTDGKVNRGE